MTWVAPTLPLKTANDAVPSPETLTTALLARVWPARKLTVEVRGAVASPGKSVR